MTAYPATNRIAEPYVPPLEDMNGNLAVFGGVSLYKIFDIARRAATHIDNGQSPAIILSDVQFDGPLFKGAPLYFEAEARGRTASVTLSDQFNTQTPMPLSGRCRFEGHIPEGAAHQVFELLSLADMLAGVKLNRKGLVPEGHVFVTRAVPHLRINLDAIDPILEEGLLFATQGQSEEDRHRWVVRTIKDAMVKLADSGRFQLGEPEATSDSGRTFKTQTRIYGRNGRIALEAEMIFTRQERRGASMDRDPEFEQLIQRFLD